jgi:hypothetical protein
MAPIKPSDGGAVLPKWKIAATGCSKTLHVHALRAAAGARKARLFELWAMAAGFGSPMTAHARIERPPVPAASLGRSRFSSLGRRARKLSITRPVIAIAAMETLRAPPDTAARACRSVQAKRLGERDQAILRKNRNNCGPKAANRRRVIARTL